MMKSRNLVGGAIVGALVLGVWLGQLWKGFGLGGGIGTAPGDSAQVPADSTAEVRSITETGTYAPTGMKREQGTPVEAEIGLPPQMITIVIHENHFRLMTDDNPHDGFDLSLSDIKARAADTIGTSEGIRVRVLKEKNAQEGARSDLLSTLAEAGIKREEIQERAEFVK